MKKTLLFFPIAACMLHGCSPKKNTPTQYEKLTWNNAKNNEHILVRPLSFDGNPKDAYGITLDSTRWYFVATQNQCAFLPIAIFAGINIQAKPSSTLTLKLSVSLMGTAPEVLKYTTEL